MAQIFCFPLQRRQKLLRELRRARTDGEVRFALRRTALALERIGVPDHIIDQQIRAVSAQSCRQIYGYGSPSHQNAVTGGDAA